MNSYNPYDPYGAADPDLYDIREEYYAYPPAAENPYEIPEGYPTFIPTDEDNAQLLPSTPQPHCNACPHRHGRASECSGYMPGDDQHCPDCLHSREPPAERQYLEAGRFPGLRTIHPRGIPGGDTEFAQSQVDWIRERVPSYNPDLIWDPRYRYGVARSDNNALFEQRRLAHLRQDPEYVERVRTKARERYHGDPEFHEREILRDRERRRRSSRERARERERRQEEAEALEDTEEYF